MIPTRSHLEITSSVNGIITEKRLAAGTRIRMTRAPPHLREFQGSYGTLLGYYDPENDLWAARFWNSGNSTTQWVPFSSVFVVPTWP